MIQSALITGVTFAFARSMTTLSPIVFLTTPGMKIMTSQILAEVDSGRFGNAFAYCTVLIAIVLSLILLFNVIIRRWSSVAAPTSVESTGTIGLTALADFTADEPTGRITLNGLTKRYPGAPTTSPPSTTSTSTSVRASSSPCWDPRAVARPRPSG